MNRTEKTELGTVLKEKFSKANLAIFVDYKGLSATKADDIRRKLRSHNTELKVLKNNIARLVTKDGSLGEATKQVMDDLVGPTLVAFSFGDPAAVAKAIHEFSKDNEEFRLKDSLMGAKKISAEEIEALAKLPSREVLLAKMLGTMNAPISNFVGVLAAVPRSLLNVLVAVERKKAEGGGGTAPAAE
jgi:large subunit ribosomal protein L10